MPLYEYRCAKCGRRTEIIQRFSDPAPAGCPHCGGALVKLLSSPAFQFKGSGFYATDYGKSGWKPGDSSKEGDSKGSEGDSSKGKEEGGGAPSEAAAEAKGDSAGERGRDSRDSSNENKDSGPGAPSDSAPGKASTAPRSPSRKKARRK